MKNLLLSAVKQDFHALSLGVEEFLRARSRGIPVLDVRSPAEYNKGHMPGAISMPLFSDEERARVGTLYTRKGKTPAISAGLEIVQSKLGHFLEWGNKFSHNNEILLYCWRGGMRSASLAGLYEKSGIASSAMTGGYKAYRNHLHEYLKNEFRFLVIGGMTGSGKTDMLRELGRLGYDNIDLEQLASHKGSVFGAIGESPQPTTEHFENLLFDKMVLPDWQKPVFIEDESLSIGSVFLPKPFHSHMLACPLLNIIVPEKERIKRLVDLYAGADKELLTYALLKIEKRLGVENTRKAVRLVHSGNFEEAVALVLGYYDKVYLRTMGIQHTTGRILDIYLNHNDLNKNTTQLLEFCKMNKLLS